MKTSLGLVLGVAALLAVAGVAGYAVVGRGLLSPTGTGSGVGTLNVYVKDAPTTNWTHVYVTFDVLSVHAADQGNDSGWHNYSVTQTVDLANLKTVSALLGSEQIPAGMYTQLRLNVTKVVGVMQNGTKVNMTVPSGVIRTDDPFNITTGQTASLTLDINLQRSIVFTAEGYLFLPVLASVTES